VAKPREDVIAKIKMLYDQGHEIILWTGNTDYAKRVALDLEKKYGIKVVAAVGKPEVIVDNEQRRWSRRLRDRVILPKEFLQRNFSR